MPEALLRKFRRLALQELSREWEPLQWATTQNNLGIVLRTLSEQIHDPVKLEVRKTVNAAFEVFMQAGQEHYRPYSGIV